MAYSSSPGWRRGAGYKSCASDRRRSAVAAAVLDHEATVLHDRDAGLRELLGKRVVTDAGLQPDRLRLLCEDVVEVAGEVGGLAEHVDHVDLARDLGERAVDLL